jgi:hypothetical protein
MRYRFLLVLCLVLTAPQVFAAEYYVSPGGGGNCSSGSPCSLVTGVNQLQCGDTLFLKGGYYGQGIGPEAGSGLPSCGSFSHTVTIRPAPGEYPTMRGVDMTGSSYIIIDGENRLVMDGENEGRIGVFGSGPYRMMNFEIKRVWEQGVYGCDEGGCEFINMHIHHIAYREDMSPPQRCIDTQHTSHGLCHGIYIAAGNVLVDGGEYHHIDGYGAHPNVGIGHNWTIRNVKFHHNRDGFLLYGDNNLVYNNLSYSNQFQAMNSFGGGTGHRLFHNTFDGPVNLVGGGQTLLNNIWTGGLEEHGGNNTKSGNLESDPGFVSPSQGDYRLQSGSPAIRTVPRLAEVLTDLEGSSRTDPTAPGAYEFGPNPTLMTPAAK